MMLIHDAVADRARSFANDVREGLGRAGQKNLPSKYLYDEVGSALFEVITMLPEYGLTRAEERILRRYLGALAECLAEYPLIIELGSGSGGKTRRLLEALPRHRSTTYCPIEISPAALKSCAREFEDLSHFNVLGFETEYLDGLARAMVRRRPHEKALVLFLGSSIGNFEREHGEEFLRGIRKALQPGDALLLGTDLEKPLSTLIPAYDDSCGVTAAFNRNLLARINCELEGNFDLSEFEHAALYNLRERRIEMHLRSLQRQTVRIDGAIFTLQRDETICTELCHKYAPNEVPEMAERTGFECVGQWLDEEWGFAESLLNAVPSTPSLEQYAPLR